MKRESLWEISVTTSLEAEEAVVETLANFFGKSSSIYTNEETKVTVVSVFCTKREEWTPRKRSALAARLKLIASTGLDIGVGKISMRRVAKEDWSESWKRHFKPIEIGSRLLIKPSWIKRAAKKNQAVVVLDPGLSFGTGNHPTTAFCLHELAINREPKSAQSFWDLGTGSGILAIAAAKLGYAPVRAVDFDPEAVRVARENARQNGVLQKIKIEREDLTQIRQTSRDKYAFICANLISNLLIAEKVRIVNRLQTSGRLVLAGILKEEFSQVQIAFEKCGLKLVSYKIDGEWCSGAFIFSS
ncbi:MAG TPA: 50S ribosomal protein L11 methyltransferase [Verrucomicrobiae bacterium]|jgi:ribosomal protein L11 methyltransferase|nr:50S ribosomal protein L11 methyltransferase [Verrucomicrobiae bacterium]